MQSNLFRFFLALALGCVAALANFVWLSGQKPSTTNYICFNRDVKQGAEIVSADLGEVSLPSGQANLKSLFVLSADSGLVRGSKAIRDFAEGELVQLRDVFAVDKPPEYRVLGPFRLISVGDRFVKDLKASGGESSASGTAVTVAAGYSGGAGINDNFEKFDLKTRRLLQITAKNQSAREKSGNLEILAVVAYPETESGGNTLARDSLGLSSQEIALFVPMPSVSAIPSVLLESNSPQIGFVVPASVLSDDELKETRKPGRM